MRWHPLAKLQSVILSHPVAVLVVSGVIVLIAAALAADVEFRTSRRALAPDDDPEQQLMNRFIDETGGAETLIACIAARDGETVPVEELRAFADELATAVRDDPMVGRVFHRVPPGWLFEHGMHLEHPEVLEETVEALREHDELFREVAGLRGLADMNRALADRIEAGLQQATAVPEDAVERTRPLLVLLDAQRRLLEEPEAFVAELERRSALEVLAGRDPRLATGGYLTTRDGDMLFVMVSPRSPDDSLDHLRRFVGAVRSRAGEVTHRRPQIGVALAGQPAMTVEEMDTIRRDTVFTSLLALAGVTVLTFLVFRWRSHVWIVLATLATGLVWALGAVRLELGYLNMITSSALSTLIGVGVAYSIHPVSEYELEGAHTDDPTATVRESFRRTTVPVAVAAITTSAAFFSILLMRFPGFAELGLVSGFGVLLCLAAALTTLPALLVVHGRWRHRRSRAQPDRAPTAVDRFWVERAASSVCRFPKTITFAAIALTVALGWVATGLGFNRNLLDLLPARSEALRHQRIMVEQTDFSPISAMVLADSVEELREMERRAEVEPAIQSFDSILRFLPRDPERSAAAVGNVRAFLEDIRLPVRVEPVSRDTLEDSLWRLEDVLAIAMEDAFATGLGDLAGVLDEGRLTVEASAELVAGVGEGSEEAWSSAQERLLLWSRDLLEEIKRAASSLPPTVDGIPAEVRARFVTPAGRYLAILQTRGSVFDPEVLDPYFAAARRVSPETTGFPIVFRDHAKRITDGFYLAVVVGFALVLAILLVDFRSPRDAVLASLPLAMGVVWMAGLMKLAGTSFNFANLVAVPLIIGVGIDNGVHIMHRVRLEGAGGMHVVLKHTARAILIASLTTMIGFGSIALASHRGLSSLGMALLLGVGSCLVASVVVLPNVLVALGIARR